MNDFFSYNKEVKLQKTIRILVYPNITYLKDLKKDSYIQAIKQQISTLNEIRDDLWFYLILPGFQKCKSTFSEVSILHSSDEGSF